MGATWPGLIRTEGPFRLTSRPDWVGGFSLAGAVARVSAMGFRWQAVPRAPRRGLERDLGDRRQERVFIGTSLDETAIRAALDACPIDTGPDRGAFDAAPDCGLPDPFLVWQRRA